MKKVILIAFSIILFSCNGKSKSAASDNSALEEQIKKLDQAHAMAIFEGDAIALDSLMSDDINVNHPTNRILNEKTELLKLMKQGVIRYSSFERNPEKFLFYDGMVVVMGNETVTPAKGAPNEGEKMQRRYTNVWMKKDGIWLLTVRHANNVCLN